MHMLVTLHKLSQDLPTVQKLGIGPQTDCTVLVSNADAMSWGEPVVTLFLSSLRTMLRT